MHSIYYLEQDKFEMSFLKNSNTNIVDPKTVFETEHQPKKPISPPKVKNNPKVKSKSQVRIEGNIENKSCCTI